MKIFSKNRKAKYDFEFLDKFEAGISLTGTEVKSIKNGDVDLSGSYIVINENGDAQWINGKIKRYKFQSMGDHEETRTRQLLLNKNELRKIIQNINEKRLTVIPYIIYANHKGRIKLEIYLAKGKNTHDKRETIKKRDLERLNK